MFILVLILFLAGALFPVALENFSSDELMEMGVYLEEFQSAPVTPANPLSNAQQGPLCSCAGLST